MNLQLVNDGRHVHIHPDQAAEVLKIHPYRRHAVFHQLCRQFYKPRKRPPPTRLAKTGSQVFEGVLGAKEAAAMSRLAATVLAETGGADGPVPGAPDEANVNLPPDDRVTRAVEKVCRKVFNAKLTGAIEAYLGCHFRIDHSAVYRSHPLAAPSGSFLWHRDVAPMAQVHIMVYLTPGGDRVGATAFLDFGRTEAAARAGYHYPNVSQRIDDIAGVLKKAGNKAKINRPDMLPGDAIALCAPRVLHRGWLPKKGHRDVLLFVLLPSIVPWHYEIEDFGCRHLFVGKIKDTLHSNPFVRFCPEVAGEDWESTRHGVEPWVVLGGLQP